MIAWRHIALGGQPTGLNGLSKCLVACVWPWKTHSWRTSTCVRLRASYVRRCVGRTGWLPSQRRVSHFLLLWDSLRNCEQDFSLLRYASSAHLLVSWIKLASVEFYVRILVEFLLACFTLLVRTSENYWAVEVRFSEKKSAKRASDGMRYLAEHQ